MTRLFTSESVTPGHPDKVCDQISDAILDAYMAVEPEAHVAVEVMATAGGFVIAGEVSSIAVDHVAVARAVIADVGYKSESGLDPATVTIRDVVAFQSAEIAAGVETSAEARDYEAFDGSDWQGAGDQGLMFGYATDETPDFMPLPIAFAHALARRLTALREHHPRVVYPDGKTQATVAYSDSGAPLRVDTIVVSTQHSRSVGQERLRELVLAEVVAPTLEEFAPLLPEQGEPLVYVNPSGSFVIGGPIADTGLTGRKIIVDTYGGMARHGGGAFSGKDPSKVDRSAAYALRWVAKNVVAAGLARRCEVQVAYAIGRAHPVGLYVETFGTGVVPDATIEVGIRSVFDLRPAAIEEALSLRTPVYRQTATFGHFGGSTRPWERLDKVEALRAATGVTGPHSEG